MRLKHLVLCAALLPLAACASYTAVNADKAVDVGDGVSVMPQIQWGQAPMTGFRGTLWTEDGASLDLLYFFTGIEPGKPLIDVRSADGKERVYDKTMLPDDVMELLVTNFQNLGYTDITTANLKPAPFGALTGFRFDLNFATHGGLLMKGTALAAQHGDKLDLIVFAAPSEYYFDHYSDTVDKLLSSVTVDAPHS